MSKLTAKDKIQIVFDGPPGPVPGRFVEVEQGGIGVNFGEWKQREDGYWVLELPLSISDIRILEAAEGVDKALAINLIKNEFHLHLNDEQYPGKCHIRHQILTLLSALPDEKEPGK